MQEIATLKRRGLSVTEICQITGHDRKTIWKYLKAPNGIPRYRARMRRPSKLEPFMAYLEECLKGGGWNVVVLLEELRKRGCHGGSTILKDYLQWRRKEAERERCGWMLAVLQGAVTRSALVQQQVNLPDLDELLTAVWEGNLSLRNRSMAVLSRERGIAIASVCRFLLISEKTLLKYCKQYREGGAKVLLARPVRNNSRKSDKEPLQQAVFSLLHTPPSVHGINRTRWTMRDLRRVLKENRQPLCQDVIREILKKAGYKWRRARVVLTRKDPEYRAKADAIRSILSELKDDEAFFSVDEYGHLRSRKRVELSESNPRRTTPCHNSRSRRGV